MNQQNRSGKCNQNDNGQPLVERELTADSNINIFDTPNIAQPGRISNQNFIGHAAQSNAGRTRRGFLGRCFTALAKLGAIMDDKILPHDYDAEEGLLTAAFCPGGLEKIDGIVTADDFYSESGKLIFSKMMEFYESGRGFTLSMIDQALYEHSMYTNIRHVLDMLIPVTAETATHFAKIVRELADRRRAIKASYEVFDGLFDISQPIDQERGFLRVQVPGLLAEVSQ